MTVMSAPQNYFKYTDCHLFRKVATNSDSTTLEQSMLSMTSYISKCIDNVTGSQDHHFLLQPEAVHELLGTKDSKVIRQP